MLTTREWKKARDLIIQQFMPRELRPDRNLAVGERLKLARQAFGFHGKGAQTRFAVEAGLKPNRYNQWEKGERYPPAEDLAPLCDKYVGLTMDWVYRANMDGMPHWLTKRLDELAAEADKKMATQAAKRSAPATPVVPLPEAKIVKVPAPKRRRA